MVVDFLLLIFSALLYALSTVFAKLINVSTAIPAFEITFFRFLLGFVSMSVYVGVTRKTARPNKKRFVIARAFSVLALVIFFFLGVQYTSIVNANMLNMTSPVFVFLIAPFINHEKSKPLNFFYLFITMVGVYLIVVPDFKHVSIGELFALISGLCGGFAISLVREARKYDDSYVILFWVMIIGLVANFFIMVPFFVLPEKEVVLWLFLAALSGFVGQIFLTIGYKKIKAATGSIIIASRIIFAAILGVTIFSDPITWRIILGGVCIIISLLGISGFWSQYLLRNKNPVH